MGKYDCIMGQTWMQIGKNKLKWDYISKRVYQSAKDLLEKKQFPKYAEQYLKDPLMLEQAIEETFRGPFREWSCHECGIMVYGPKKWLHFHLGKHGRFKERENRGGEIYQMKFGIFK